MFCLRDMIAFSHFWQNIIEVGLHFCTLKLLTNIEHLNAYIFYRIICQLKSRFNSLKYLKIIYLGHEKHSNSRGANSSSSKDHVRESATGSRHWSSSSSRDDSDVPSKESRSTRKHSDENIQSTQDMDISPGDSTPTSEVSYGNNAPQPTNEQNTMGPVLLANALPRLISHPIHVPSTPAGRPEASPQSTSALMPVPATITTSNAPGPPSALATLPRIMSQTTPSDNIEKNSHSLQRPGDSAVHTSLSIDTNHSGTVVEGPPTPTHSETPDCAKGE